MKTAELLQSLLEAQQRALDLQAEVADWRKKDEERRYNEDWRYYNEESRYKYEAQRRLAETQHEILRGQNDEHQQAKALEKRIIRYKHTFVTLKGDVVIYCSVCWDRSRKLIQMTPNYTVSPPSFNCHDCKNIVPSKSKDVLPEELIELYQIK